LAEGETPSAARDQITTDPTSDVERQEITFRARQTEESPMRVQQPTPPTRATDTASWMTLRWVRGTRYYRVHLEQDLWNAWVVTQVHGRIGTRWGRARALPAPSIESALLRLADITNRRRQRGYVLKN